MAEKLTGENKYHCDKCKTLCDAQRIINILQAPTHLILTLKHFSYDSESRLRTKLPHKVAYSESIKLPVSTPNSTVTEAYQLYAAVVHSGYSMDYGHYFTYACDSKQNWYKFNDCCVLKTTLEDFKRLEPPDTPYILFYEKCTSSEGMFEEEKPELQSLSKRLQESVARDMDLLNDESRQLNERKLNKLSSMRSVYSRKNPRDEDDNPPPSSCRGATNITRSHFQY